jgi:hypothetical protein
MFHQEFDVPSLHTAVKNAMTWHVVGGGSSSAMGSRMFPRANMCVHCLQLLVCVICLQRKLCYFSLFEAEYMTFQQLLLREYFCERQQLPNLASTRGSTLSILWLPLLQLLHFKLFQASHAASHPTTSA